MPTESIVADVRSTMGGNPGFSCDSERTLGMIRRRNDQLWTNTPDQLWIIKFCFSFLFLTHQACAPIGSTDIQECCRLWYIRFSYRWPCLTGVWLALLLAMVLPPRLPCRIWINPVRSTTMTPNRFVPDRVLRRSMVENRFLVTPSNALEKHGVRIPV